MHTLYRSPLKEPKTPLKGEWPFGSLLKSPEGPSFLAPEAPNPRTVGAWGNYGRLRKVEIWVYGNFFYSVSFVLVLRSEDGHSNFLASAELSTIVTVFSPKHPLEDFLLEQEAVRGSATSAESREAATGFRDFVLNKMLSTACYSLRKRRQVFPRMGTPEYRQLLELAGSSDGGNFCIPTFWLLLYQH